MSQEEKLAPVISIINKKGGVGKTTTVINLAADDIIRSGINEDFEGACYTAVAPALDKTAAENVKATSPRFAKELKSRRDKIRSAFDGILNSLELLIFLS